MKRNRREVLLALAALPLVGSVAVAQRNGDDILRDWHANKVHTWGASRFYTQGEPVAFDWGQQTGIPGEWRYAGKTYRTATIFRKAPKDITQADKVYAESAHVKYFLKKHHGIEI